MNNAITVKKEVLGFPVNVKLKVYNEGKSFYVNTGAVSQVVKQVLKQKFPTLKLKVQSKSYSGGDHITINFSEEPTKEAVSEIRDFLNPFVAGEFDGMTDSYNYKSLSARAYIEHEDQSISLTTKYLFINIPN